jgi:acetyl-CoA carboxylase biotin carboxylase subunit
VFRKILIANRGEIAVRVIRACRALGVSNVAIYSEADAGALHVELADEAYPCGPAPARDSYLAAERILEIARACGADALHPGYGFLSESGDFAEQCEAAGVCFIGPPARVIRAMGDKLAARRVVARAGVPVVPGSHAAVTPQDAPPAARALGYPVLVKAAAGGGGRGMRCVEHERDLAAAVERAASEARSAFGHAAVYLEKRLARPRHIEVQLLADSHGSVLQLFERECSIQRRHQKLIEEAPAGHVGTALRERLGAAAVAVARAVGYASVGTCEFLLDAEGRFYFLEMNTRIQVEHAVTEAVTGVDLVQAMIGVAAGEPLALRQADLALTGHAIEARIYAEDPERKFLPSPGRLARFDPPAGPGVRVDSGVRAGDRVSVHYDALLAKLIAWGEDRPAAIERLRGALDAFAVEGVATSLAFHRRAVVAPEFAAGRYDTGFADALMGRISAPQRGVVA